MRRVITIDIETLPNADVSAISKQNKKTEEESSVDLKTALNGDFGRLLCIGYIDETPGGKAKRGVIGWDEESGAFTLNEREMLAEFWQLLRGFRPNFDRIVGHCIFDFDLKFILKRSVIHGIPPTVDLSFARYRNTPIYCTCAEWERWSYGAKISLDKLAKVLGLPSSKAEGVNGSHVFDMFQRGEYRALRDYCLRDVVLTRAIYRKMTFADSASSTREQSHGARLVA